MEGAAKPTLPPDPAPPPALPSPKLNKQQQGRVTAESLTLVLVEALHSSSLSRAGDADGVRQLRRLELLAIIHVMCERVEYLCSLILSNKVEDLAIRCSAVHVSRSPQDSRATLVRLPSHGPRRSVLPAADAPLLMTSSSVAPLHASNPLHVIKHYCIVAAP
uniref:Uncharacterized protein n=1 Tax=Oryza sativa subsp. indica TaxID=39946 RepID=Q0P185_ORYSI|nr:hypothetical protein TQR13L11.7 [Oryza sativa Indica Group]